MYNIKFSHPYRKLFVGGQIITRAKLLSVESVKLQDLTAEFLDYDTDGGKYELPKKGNYLRLTFLKPGQDAHLFTTLRSDRPGKKEYYTEKIGQLFEVVLTENMSL
jgi:hypothetical protein